MLAQFLGLQSDRNFVGFIVKMVQITLKTAY